VEVSVRRAAELRYQVTMAKDATASLSKDDIDQTRADVVRRAIEVSEVFHHAGGQWRVPGYTCR